MGSLETDKSSLTYASLNNISFNGLLHRDSESVGALREAVVENGFFYLTLDAALSGTLELRVAKMFPVCRDLFELPLNQKMKFDTKTLANERNYGFAMYSRCCGFYLAKSALGTSQKEGTSVSMNHTEMVMSSI